MSFWPQLWSELMTPIGVAIFGIGFLAGIIPQIINWIKGAQTQQTADIGTSLAQTMQAIIPLMMFMTVMQMFMGMFRMPATPALYTRYY